VPSPPWPALALLHSLGVRLLLLGGARSPGHRVGPCRPAGNLTGGKVSPVSGRPPWTEAVLVRLDSVTVSWAEGGPGREKRAGPKRKTMNFRFLIF
jgi:hypothetical protein